MKLNSFDKHQEYYRRNSTGLNWFVTRTVCSYIPFSWKFFDTRSLTVVQVFQTKLKIEKVNHIVIFIVGVIIVLVALEVYCQFLLLCNKYLSKDYYLNCYTGCCTYHKIALDMQRSWPSRRTLFAAIKD